MSAPAAARGSTIRDALESASDALAAAGVDTPRFDAEVLLAAATGRNRAALAADVGGDLPAAAGRWFADAVRRRLRREPVAYITGTRGFRRLEIAVDSRVLIPRPETELLVEVALELGPRTVLDVGTGSGAVALAIADEIPEATVVATDMSPGAVAMARENARRLGLSDRVRVQQGTVPEGGGAAGGVPGAGFDLAVANLPYVREDEWAGLAPEIREWEPREALLAGADGLDAYRAVLPQLSAAVIALEVGEGQAEAVAGLAEAAGFSPTEARPDLAGIERVVVGRRQGADGGDGRGHGAET
jgi:release factor glutamine methyltransferase